jgi:predicted secreted protein
MLTAAARSALAAAAMAALAPAAGAGDFSEHAIFGFSETGSHFAFQEYGTEDGSGFPYASVYVIDVATDSWLPGTPFRVRLEEDGATEAEARAETEVQSASLRDQHGTRFQPSRVASNPVTELTADPGYVVVNPRLVVPPIDDPYAFRLVTYPLPGAELCEDFGQTRGFRLTVERDAQDGPHVVAHADSAIPASRGCPLDYRIEDIYTFFPEAGPPVFAALVRVIKVGFEGPDGRLVAVTGRLPD